MQAIALYWFAVQQQSSTFRQQKIVFFYVNLARDSISLVLISKSNRKSPKNV